MKIILILIGLCMLPLSLFAEEQLRIVPSVDINRYLGTWYEIARYPNGFQIKCERSWVEYSLRDDDKIQVINRCSKFDGKISKIKGKAWVYDKETNAKLKVQFFWPFSANYWIIDLGEDYEYVVVSEPKRKFLWILSRTKIMPEDKYQQIIQNLIQKGFDTSKLFIDPWENYK